MTLTIPLFPLQTVLFPDGPLPLRIFEPRYLDMVSHCLKNDEGIGVVLIKEGSEVGKAAKTYDVGTLTNIQYWHKRSDGLLGVTLHGEQRFRILSQRVEKSQLLVGEVEMLPNPPDMAVPEKHQVLVDLLQQIVSQLEPPYTTMKTHYDNANWVSARLVELLPIGLAEKQRLLQEDNIEQCMKVLARVLNKMEIL